MKVRTVVVASSLALVSVACAGSSQEAEPAASPTSSPAPSPAGLAKKIVLSDGQEANDYGTAEVVSGKITMIMDLNHFQPTAVVGPGARRSGSISSTRARIFTISPSRNKDVDVEVPAGESAVATATIPESGAVTFICNYHDFLFMRGELRAA